MTMDVDGRTYGVRKFSYFSSEDPADLRFAHESAWSRIYDYPFALAEIRAANLDRPHIHNCAWGQTEIAAVFKAWLDLTYENVLHSDARPSSLCRTAVWDITLPSTEAFHGRFDVVLNVSNLEETACDHVEVIKNHLIQLTKGGRFIATFGEPGFQLAAIERFLDERVVTPPSRLTPGNSRLAGGAPASTAEAGRGYLVIERVG
jgi:hypothetical protein